MATVRTVAGGEVVIREGDIAEFVYGVFEGALMVEKGRGIGQFQIVGFLLSGDMFGVVHGDCYSYGVRAAVAGELLEFPRDAFEVMCDTYPSVQRAMLHMASNELAAAQDHLVILGRKSASERVASFLLNLDERRLRQGYSAESPIWLPMRRADVANHLGLTLETVSRVFSDIKRRRIITAQGVRAIQIQDRSALQSMAEKT